MVSGLANDDLIVRLVELDRFGFKVNKLAKSSLKKFETILTVGTLRES